LPRLGGSSWNILQRRGWAAKRFRERSLASDLVSAPWWPMFSPEMLFIRNLDRLKTILENPSEDGLFESAGLLRALLVDESPLLHQVNRALRLKVSFLVNSVTPDPPGLEPSIRIIAEGISPSLVPKTSNEVVNLDRLLKYGVLQIDGEWASVRDIIKYVANYAGAIHKSTPDTPTTKNLEAVGQSIRVGGAGSVLRSLHGIIDVVVRGSQPLYMKIKEPRPG
jgi:hypothetical protein